MQPNQRVTASGRIIGLKTDDAHHFLHPTYQGQICFLIARIGCELGRAGVGVVDLVVQTTVVGVVRRDVSCSRRITKQNLQGHGA